MSALVECPECGCEYPPEATRGLCPECEMETEQPVKFRKHED